MFLEKLAPFVVEKNAIGLESVFHHLSGPAVLFDEFDRVPEKLDLHQRGLAALPGHDDLRRAM
ncbi:hypothetical protein LMG28138_05794 [Pararobbsia alpina]|uniref:Uncharacterized protein n=1 Tax=Pararobbsia alpina TaxID=621374 RepID=A0A6S7CCV9_9BURK|nr:hypothetical protein LMG28138_05794 [Pararobbsia alpina]